MHDTPLSLPPLSLYVHIPWCIRKCPYCDFNSHASGKHLPEAEYVQALIRELDMEMPYAQGRQLSSIFFGGGTPSLFSAESIGRVIQAARRRFGFTDTIEITLEANPGTFEQAKFNGFRNVGVNRLSIGIQSFDNRHLEKLGRIHSAENARDAVAMARSTGFDNINLDLMHGLPAQTEQEAMADLQQAIDLAPTHISWYQLTIEPNTEFYRRPPTLPTEDVLDTIQQSGHQLLADNGFFQYEVSAFCREKKFSLHNRNYWQFGDYLGIGAGAHGKITLPDEQRIIRTAKTRKPDDYLARENSFIAHCKNILENELPLEFMMNALRLNQGIEKPYFEARTGISLDKINETCEKLMIAGLLENSSSHLVTTKKGHRFLNTVLCYFSE
ncbi:radical SAM family heme chaperone HemW [Porticoccus sp.]|uniref:radical SAM family heme chaperone HemW n=1 Tax=Porticoccus sp. TaxID=2024853 RepID=UPI003F6A10CA